MRPAQGRTATHFDSGFLHKPLFMVLAPGSAHTIIRQANLMSAPFFLQHPETESPAVVVLVNSRCFAMIQDWVEKKNSETSDACAEVRGVRLENFPLSLVVPCSIAIE